ncbi:hypothetical protein H8E06_00780 [bacterium]|nr:hypothetical protein [bacterium]
MGKFEDMIQETYGTLNKNPDTDEKVDGEEKEMIDQAAAKGDPKAKNLKTKLDKETEKAIKDGENSLRK